MAQTTLSTPLGVTASRAAAVAARPRSAGAHRKALVTAAGLHTALLVAAALTMVPFAWVVLGSFRSTAELTADPTAWWPHVWTLDNYARLLGDGTYVRQLANTVGVTAAVVVGNLVLSSMVGYALARLDFPGKKVVMGAVMAGLMVPFSALFLPQFVVVVKLGLLDTLTAIAAPLLCLPVAVFIMRQYALTLPEEVFEAARLDGAGELAVFFRIFLPMTGPALATQAVFTFLAAWNNFLWPLVVAQSGDTYTLPVALAALVQSPIGDDRGLQLAGAVLIMAPVLAMFVALQRYVVAGVATTGLK